MNIDFFEGLASTVNDVFNPIFDLAFKFKTRFSLSVVDPRESRDLALEIAEPYR